MHLRALVTGAAGFIGSTLVDALLARGDEVIGIDSLTDYYDSRLKRANLANVATEGFTFIEADLNHFDLGTTLRDVNVVFHQAGQPGVRKSWGRDFEGYTAQNVLATQTLLEWVKKSETVEKVVYASSSSVYGTAESFPTRETDLPRPLSPYGVTKLAAEHLMSLYAENFGIATTSLRYFTVYGPRQRPDMAFTRFLRSALTGEQITLFGDGEQIRDFTFVDDIVAANLAAVDRAVVPGSVFNISGGSSVSVNEVLDLVERIAAARLDIHRLPRSSGDVRRTGGDTSAAEAALGWTASTSLEVGLSRQLDWLRSTASIWRDLPPNTA